MEGIRNWVKAHPNLWEFILFNLLSNCATIINFIVMWLCTGFIFTAFNTRPFQFFIFRYTNVDRDLGLCGFLSFLVATAVAQTVNFFVQKNLVFKSNAAFENAVPKYMVQPDNTDGFGGTGSTGTYSRQCGEHCGAGNGQFSGHEVLDYAGGMTTGSI